MLSQSKIQHAFHRALSSYNDQAIVQKDSAATLVEHLVNCGINTSLERVFEFGCGTGFLTQQLAERFSIEELVANDLIAECQTYLPYSNFNFITGDVADIVLPSQCDLVCSASCVQWSNDLSQLLTRLTNSLTDNGYLAISSFTGNHFRELATLQNQQPSLVAEKLNYWSAQQWRKNLEPNFEIKVITTQEKRMWFDSVRLLLLHLRLTGVNGNAGHAWNKRSLAKFESDYRDNFELDGKVPLSYQPIYIIAQKNLIRP